MRRHLSITTVIWVWLAFVALPVYGAATLMDSINDSFAPMDNYRWEVAEVGWLFVPNSTYNLSRVETSFSSVDGRSVTIDIYDAHPLNGNLLASGTFSPSSATNFEGATLDQAVTLNAGEDYFIAFRNVFRLGVNVTDANGAENLGSAWWDLTGDGSFGTQESGSYTAQPILRLYGSVVPDQPTESNQSVWGGFSDGRINRFDVAPPVVIYPAYGGLHLYLLNADGSGSLALVVTPEMLAAAPDGEFVLVAANDANTVQVFKLGTQYQVNAVFADGKLYVAIFDIIDSESPIQSYTNG